MDFLAWKKALMDSIDSLGFRATARKFGLSISSLQNIQKGDEYAGLQSWKRLGAHSTAAKFKEESK